MCPRNLGRQQRKQNCYAYRPCSVTNGSTLLSPFQVELILHAKINFTKSLIGPSALRHPVQPPAPGKSERPETDGSALHKWLPLPKWSLGARKWSHSAPQLMPWSPHLSTSWNRTLSQVHQRLLLFRLQNPNHRKLRRYSQIYLGRIPLLTRGSSLLQAGQTAKLRLQQRPCCTQT